ncbi:arabinogalactan protein 41-like [Alnus glutinosa]|uniref:arabinogalactan protein 41-like n=1 Tax=Alnus glutinosa TaxID=3517 RepID=UPI002D78F238|nr:arabinogalactan protein 41-like [Alnus glutinosa]
MAVSRMSFGVVAVAAAVFAVLVVVFLPAVQAESVAPAPAPTSDGASIDQGIACVLMLLALVLTYLIHAADMPKSF